MGKISKALAKYSSERKKSTTAAPAAPAKLTYDDIAVLVGYDPTTGHLLKCDPATGQVDNDRIEELKSSGTIFRLLEQRLIYPGGKLTPRGIEQAMRLEALAAAIPARQPAGQRAEKGLPPYLSKSGPESRTIAPALPETQAGIASAPVQPLPPAEDGLKIVPAATPVAAKGESPPATFPRPLKLVSETKPQALPPAAPPKEAPVQQTDRAGRAPKWNEADIDPMLVSMTAPHSHEAEQFKILRTNILFPLAGHPPRSILVTSSAPGEGKTFAAANLAISIALNINRHVLLIDADMRMPQLHKRFGFGPVPGLSNYLAEGSLLPSLLLKTKVDKLTLLPAGPPPENPAELIGAERMSSLLSEVTNRYPDRIVVIDAPPPALAAETGVLARQVDGILIVVRYGSTRCEAVADLVAQVGQKKILGSIVNYIETAASRYYGYKYGGYGRPSKK
ncbi:MAG: polysaccharide biosynthesis tyrosine autokinase [Desulfobacterales bacterium]|nr:polysaccharide biosynthesis tyrosine autokinase [Desulfobacterales bacterium]